MHTDLDPSVPSKPLLSNAPTTRCSLQRMVAKLTSHSFWHEDLVQDGLLHLWQQEQISPGQSTCWYLCSCQFHLRNRLRHGSSIDSLKRRHHSAIAHSAQSDGDDVLGLLVDWRDDAAVFEVVVARDIVDVLLRFLTLAEREILGCLLEGMGVRETARQLNLSHTCVVKRRRRICSFLCQLDPTIQSSRILPVASVAPGSTSSADWLSS